MSEHFQAILGRQETPGYLGVKPLVKPVVSHRRPVRAAIRGAAPPTPAKGETR